MGKKQKTGKARKDKFYHLAKETGYRARSAFKLLQLNRKFEFLQKSRVCVDLCAAPGGWMQVAANEMPVSSLIIGVDLVPIKPIPGCTSFQEDITTAKCKQQLKKELQDWKVDVFLNDGAPNVGMNWIHDAFQQAQLALAAMKLSTEFLKKGGWFITKVFRSKDYHALMWVFNQLFRKVHATKPQASRNESAEIFVVCQGYHAPDKLDPRFTDPTYVFKDSQLEPRNMINLIHPEKISKKAEGYADGDMTLYHKLPASKFLTADNHLDLLAQCNEIVIDDENILKHPKTTKEIRECVKDIKVLGKKEIRALISWHKILKKHLAERKEKQEKEEEEESMETEEAEEEEDVSDHNEEEKELSEKLAAVKDEEQKEMKKKRKKVLKDKRKLRDKMSLNMVIPGDSIDMTDDAGIFSLKKIKSKAQLKKVENQNIEDAQQSESESEDEETRRAMVKYDRYKSEVQEDVMGPESEDEEDVEDDEQDLEFETDSEAEEEGKEEEKEEDEEEDEEVTKGRGNPLVIEMETKDVKTQRKMDLWFKKDVFAGLEDEEDEDLEIEDTVKQYKMKGGVVLGKELTKSKEKLKAEKEKEEFDEMTKSNYSKQFSDSESDSDFDSDSDDDSDDDSDGSEYDHNDVLTAGSGKQEVVKQKKTKAEKAAKKDGFEIVPQDQPMKKVRKLDPIGLAIGEEMVKSRKRRREIEEMSYHRFTFNDDHLPDWFAKEEQRHMKKPMPVSKEQVDVYKERQKAIDARPIKKVAEAKARKQRKMTKKLEKARKKAEVISDTVDVTDKEKWSKIRDVYKRAGLTKKKKESVAYVVAKRGTGKKVSRPAGVKGHFRVVDPRMKKDDKARKGAEKKKGKKGKSSSNRTKSSH